MFWQVIDDTPKALLALLVTALALGHMWVAVDRSSSIALALRQRWTPQARRIVVVVLALTAFIAVADDVVFEERDESIVRLDHAVAAWLTGFKARRLAIIVGRLTGEGLVVLVGLGALALLSVGRRQDALMLVVGTLTAWGMTGLLKTLCAVQRPRLTGYGFPSGHVVVTVVALGTMAWALSRGRHWLVRVSLLATAGVIAVATGLSRVMLRVHWTSDVLGGLAFGVAWLTLVIEGAEWGLPRSPDPPAGAAAGAGDTAPSRS
jgi:membrane-associated phospholipid phosphatase